MPQVRKPKFKIIYNKKDITADITPYLISITYKDATQGKSDELQLELSNTTGIWLDQWYPIIGDTISASMGYDDQLFNCGLFEIDEVEWTIMPDVINIKAIAAGINEPTRTRRSDQHEGKTLSQIVQKIASRNGYKVIGTIDARIKIDRETQTLETDLGYLSNLALKYGYLFSVRGKVITFTNIYEIEKLKPVTSITRESLTPGCVLRDKSRNTYKKVHLSHYNPDEKGVLETTFEFPDITNVDGFTYSGIVKKDTKEVRSRVGSGAEAQQKAIASLHSSNSKQQEGVLKMAGNPRVLAGNNFSLEGCGKLSGNYHATATIHRLNVKSGYNTEVDVKRVGFIDILKAKRKKPKKIKPVTIDVVK